jgi:hypothetical protein
MSSSTNLPKSMSVFEIFTLAFACLTTITVYSGMLWFFYHAASGDTPLVSPGAAIVGAFVTFGVGAETARRTVRVTHCDIYVGMAVAMFTSLTTLAVSLFVAQLFF